MFRCSVSAWRAIRPAADPLVAFLFGLFHDAMRQDEGDDPGHGPRGAALARRLAAEGLLSVHPEQLHYLLHTCETHTEAPPTPDCAPVGVCYDADRLNLWRVDIEPEAKYLSTPAGIALVRARFLRTLHDQPLTWEEILPALEEATV